MDTVTLLESSVDLSDVVKADQLDMMIDALVLQRDNHEKCLRELEYKIKALNQLKTVINRYERNKS